MENNNSKLKKLSVFRVPCSVFRNKGFTLIEMLVTTGIFIIMTGVVLANYHSYAVNADFSNASENIVLSLREAQVYGAGGRRNAIACPHGNTAFDCEYGVYFNKTDSPYSYILFVDLDGNEKFTSGEEYKTIPLGHNIKVSNLLCGDQPCTNGLNILFKRPAANAIMRDSSAGVLLYDTVSIIISNDTNTKSATTTLTSAGQISLK